MDYFMKKSDLRRDYLARRAALTEAEYRDMNDQLVEQLFAAYSFEKFGTVHCFLPSERQREVDTWPIVRRLRTRSSGRVVVPRCGVGTTLTHHELTPETVLKNNRWGIPEPVDSRPCPVAEIDLVLVPLLAFDRRGHRVGYGQGFYDRFLRTCRPDTPKVGLSLFPPVELIEDVFAGDVVLDAVVMPGEVLPFGIPPSAASASGTK